MTRNLTETVSSRQRLTESDWVHGPTTTTLEGRALLSEMGAMPLVVDDPHARIRSSYDAPRDYPVWLWETLQRFDDVLELSENWDSYGARPVSFSNVEYAFELLLFINKQNTPVPSVVPTAEGSVQLEWHEGGIDLEIEVLAPYRIEVSYQNHEEPLKDYERVLTNDLTDLSKAIFELSRRASGT